MGRSHLTRSPWRPARRRSSWSRATSPATAASSRRRSRRRRATRVPPCITAALANDTGSSSTDGITSDPTITGVVDDPSGVASFQAGAGRGTLFDGSRFLERRELHAHAGEPGDAQRRRRAGRRHHTRRAASDGQPRHQSTAIAPVVHAREHAAVAAIEHAFDPERPDGDEQHDHQGTLAHRRDVGARRHDRDALHERRRKSGSRPRPSAPLDFAVPGTLADGQYLFTATAGTVSGLVSPFSTPFTVTVDNTPPAIASFGLDTLSDARPFGHNLTQMAVVGFTGQTEAGRNGEVGGDGRTDHGGRLGQLRVLSREPAEPGRLHLHGAGD